MDISEARLGTFEHSRWQNVWWLFGLFWKTSILSKKLLILLLGNFGLLLIFSIWSHWLSRHTLWSRGGLHNDPCNDLKTSSSDIAVDSLIQFRSHWHHAVNQWLKPDKNCDSCCTQKYCNSQVVCVPLFTSPVLQSQKKLFLRRSYVLWILHIRWRRYCIVDYLVWAPVTPKPLTTKFCDFRSGFEFATFSC